MNPNQLQLIGTLIKKDPLKFTRTQKAILSFYIKVEEKGYEGKKEEKIFKIISFGDLAQFIDSSLPLNTLIQVMGKALSKVYTPPNQRDTKYYTDLLATEVFSIQKASFPSHIPAHTASISSRRNDSFDEWVDPGLENESF